jgi:cbb3-type cytochrome oxidase subunit 3
MYTEILSRIEGIHVFPVLSLILFVAVFTGVLVWVVRADARELMRRAAMPLDAHDAPVDPAPVSRRSA